MDRHSSQPSVSSRYSSSDLPLPWILSSPTCTDHKLCWTPKGDLLQVSGVLGEILSFQIHWPPGPSCLRLPGLPALSPQLSENQGLPTFTSLCYSLETSSERGGSEAFVYHVSHSLSLIVLHCLMFRALKLLLNNTAWVVFFFSNFTWEKIRAHLFVLAWSRNPQEILIIFN
jgi:hypothetical protein